KQAAEGLGLKKDAIRYFRTLLSRSTSMHSQFYASQNSKKSSGSHAYIHSNCLAKNIYGSATHVLTGAIIPPLMHRIPSELRSEACLGESSTRMGDPRGVLVLHPLF